MQVQSRHTSSHLKEVVPGRDAMDIEEERRNVMDTEDEQPGKDVIAIEEGPGRDTKLIGEGPGEDTIHTDEEQVKGLNQVLK